MHSHCAVSAKTEAQFDILLAGNTQRHLCEVERERERVTSPVETILAPLIKPGCTHLNNYTQVHMCHQCTVLPPRIHSGGSPSSSDGPQSRSQWGCVSGRGGWQRRHHTCPTPAAGNKATPHKLTTVITNSKDCRQYSTSGCVARYQVYNAPPLSGIQ